MTGLYGDQLEPHVGLHRPRAVFNPLDEPHACSGQGRSADSGACGYLLVEVKSETSVKDYYYADAAIQTWVV